MLPPSVGVISGTIRSTGASFVNQVFLGCSGGAGSPTADAPEFIAGCAKRGITDMSTVCVDPWSAGNFDVPGEEGRHLCHVFSWQRLYENENFYAHPIEGLNAVIDLKTGEIIRVDDYGVVPVPQQQANYEHQFIKTPRAALKPINVVQPEGVNFSLEGSKLTWHKWSLVVGFNAREALTLHNISYDGRSVLNRASLVEMVVPYRSPDNGHFRKHVFDIGEYGIGKLANSLKLGCDCLGAIEYLDVHLNTMDGDVMTIEKVICIHEEDSGLLWKHWDFRTDRAEIRRARKLVVSTICTVGNYEYALYWYFHIDGAIEFEVKATGIINTAACIPGAPGKYATEVSPGVVGHIHQHLFCARLDMEIDGEKNTFVECNTYAEPAGPNNPYGNAFFQQETVLRSESEAARRANVESQRYLEGDQSEQEQCCRLAGGLQARRHQLHHALRRAGFTIRQACRLRAQPRLGHRLRRRGALSRRRIYEPLRRRRRHCGFYREGPADRERRHRALARVRAASSRSHGGLPRAARDLDGFQADALGVLQRQPLHRPAARGQQGELQRPRVSGAGSGRAGQRRFLA